MLRFFGSIKEVLSYGHSFGSGYGYGYGSGYGSGFGTGYGFGYGFGFGYYRYDRKTKQLVEEDQC